MLYKVALMFFAFGLSYEFIAFRIHGLESAVAAAVFIALMIAYLGILLVTAFLKSFTIRLLWTAVLVPAFLIYESAQRIFGEPLSYSGFITLVSARGFIGDSLRQFGSQLSIPVLQSAMLSLSILLPTARRMSFRPPAAPFYPLLGTAAMVALLYVRGGYGASGLPSMFTTLSYGALYLYEEAVESRSSRRSVEITPQPESVPNDVVLIIDESVRGDYLDINSPSGVYSGLDRIRPGVDVHNFGIAASASHCSDATNLIIRYGSTREALRRYIRTMPSIWEYAHVAGYRTVYVDAQRSGGALHNRMSGEERDQIDLLVQFDHVPVLGRDMATIPKLNELLSDSVPDFIYVNKVGAHFPVHDKYPDEFMLYEPVLPRGALGSISDTGDRVGLFSGDWVAYVNSYRNTLAWSVGEYFDQFFEKLNLDDAVVIYTADHGQTFHERGEPGYNTHCSINPVPEEGVVPLVAILGRHVEDSGFAKAAVRHFNQASQFGLFPTVLRTMGFDSADIDSIYEPAWFDEEKLPFSFNFTFNARLGAAQKFMPISLESLKSHVSSSM